MWNNLVYYMVKNFSPQGSYSSLRALTPLRSLASAFAPKAYIFIIFIACLGVGVAAITPAAIGLCTAYFQTGAARNRAFGIIGGVQAVGFILGLTIGMNLLAFKLFS